LHHLRLFAAVVDNGGFTKAAAALRLSQPAISKSLTDLERTLGVSLIDRGGRTLRLTDAGKTLYARATELFGVERAAEQEVREIRGLERGVLRIGASTTIATYLLPPVLGRFHQAHPGVRIRVTSANTRTVLRMLVRFQVDVALVEGPVSHERVHVHDWREDELVVIAHPDHELFATTDLDVSLLRDQRFLVREPGSGTRDVTERALAEHGVRLTNTMRVGGTEAIKQAVAAGLGLAIVSRAAAEDQLVLGKIAVLPVSGLTMRRRLTRLTLQGRSSSAAASELEAMLDDRRIEGEEATASRNSGAPAP